MCIWYFVFFFNILTGTKRYDKKDLKVFGTFGVPLDFEKWLFLCPFGHKTNSELR